MVALLHSVMMKELKYEYGYIAEFCDDKGKEM